MLPHPPRAVLFDLDGTLLNSIALIQRSFRMTFEKHGLPEIEENAVRDLIGRTLKETFAVLVPNRSEHADLIESYRGFDRALHDELASPYEGAVEIIKRLDHAGVPIALVTSKMRPGAELGLRLLDIEAELQVTVCGDDVVNGKPHPEGVFSALNQLGIEASKEVYFLGDSPHDIGAAERAGVSSIAAAWGPYPDAALASHSPDHTFQSLPELQQALLG